MSIEYSGVVVDAEPPFVIVDEVTPPAIPPPPILADDDLIVHVVMLPGDPHVAAGHLNGRLAEFIGGILTVQFQGTHSGVALIRATRGQIEQARREGRL